MTTTTHYGERVLRVTPSGSTFYSYRYAESFGRETREAHSWGCRQKRGTAFPGGKRGSFSTSKTGFLDNPLDKDYLSKVKCKAI